MPNDKLIKRDALVPNDPQVVFKAVAMDIGKEVAHHIEIMYPDAVKATSSTFLLSVRNCTYNRILAAIKVNSVEETLMRLEANKQWRRTEKAAYRKIREDK